MTKERSQSRLVRIGLKFIALAIGYALWCIFAQTQMVSVAATLPLLFDSTNELRSIEAPETISITITGQRQFINAIDFASLAAHFNVDNLTPGENTITLTSKNLFLPAHINLVHYEPLPLKITINDQPKIDPEQQGARG